MTRTKLKEDINFIEQNHNLNIQEENFKTLSNYMRVETEAIISITRF